MRITDAEFTVMEALWRGQPLSADALIEEVRGQTTWGEATVRTLINRLLRKGAIRSERSGGRHHYHAVLERTDHVQAESENLLDRLFGGQLAPLVAQFAERKALTEDDRKRLKAIIERLDDPDLAAVLIELNAALVVAVVFVGLVRVGVRRRWGARAAYGLWWAVPAAMVGVCLPGAGAAVLAPEAGPVVLGPPAIEALLGVWLCGVVVSALAVAMSQARFTALARRGLAGPAATGVIVGRVVMPADSASRWTPDELALIRAHERAHMDRGDLRINGLVALGRCLFWCNPFAHLGAALLRFDQELACDAAVMTMRPGRRRLYGEALLKAAPAAPIALGCGWVGGPSGLEARLRALGGRTRPASPSATTIGLVALALCGSLAWGLQPPRTLPPEPRAAPILVLRLQPDARLAAATARAP